MINFKKFCHKMKKEDGYILPLVIVIMIVISIFLVSSFNLINTNTQQVALQENNMRAYYLSKAGIDMAYAALLDDHGTGKSVIFDLYQNNSTVTDELDLPIDDPIGKVKITASKNGSDEVRIRAVTDLDDTSGSSNLSLILNITNETGVGYRIDYDKTRWERN